MDSSLGMMIQIFPIAREFENYKVLQNENHPL